MNTCRGCKHSTRPDMEGWLEGYPLSALDVCRMCFLWIKPENRRANYEPIPDIRARLTAMATECKTLASAAALCIEDGDPVNDPWLIAHDMVSEAGDALREAADAVGKALDAPKEGGERFVGFKPRREEP